MHNINHEVAQFLEKNNINFAYYEHIPVFTVAESEEIKEHIPCTHSKNLFLDDKAGNYYLVSIAAHKRFPVNLFRKLLSKKNLSFGTPEQLFEQLQLKPGSVSIFGLLHSSAKNVEFFLDEALWQADCVGRHPNRNDATLVVDQENLQKYCQAINKKPKILRFNDNLIEEVTL